MFLEKFVNPYRKVIAAVVGAIGSLVTLSADGVLTSAEWFAVGVAFLTAVGVYGAANAPTFDQLKRLYESLNAARSKGQHEAAHRLHAIRSSQHTES